MIKDTILRLDIVDDDFSDHPLDTYYLINPNEKKLVTLKQMIERRFEDAAMGVDNPFIDSFLAITDYINENFETVDVKTREIEW